MSIVHQLDGCGVTVSEAKGPDGEAVGRQLVIVHAQSDQVWVLNFDVSMADDVGGQLQGQSPKKHLEVAGAIPPEMLRGKMNGG